MQKTAIAGSLSILPEFRMLAKQRTAEEAVPLCPIPERLDEMTLDILRPWPALQEQAQAFFRQYGHVFEDLAQCSRVERLTRIFQLGVKQEDMEGRYAHHRWLHSQHVAAHAVAIGIKLGMSVHDVLVSALAGCLHDVAYGPFSHDSDYFLEPNGYEAHEERGKRLIMTDVEIAAVLHNAKVNPEHVVRVVAEEGAQGQVQSFSDTGAYVVLDSLVYGIAVPRPRSGRAMSSEYVASIVGVTDHEIVVNNRRPLAWAFHRRGELGQRYFSPWNKLTTAALVKSLQYLYVSKQITLEEVALADDVSMAARLRAMAHDRRLLVPEWWRSLALLALNDVEQAPYWHQRTFATPMEREVYIGSLRKYVAENVVRVNPWDYTSKVLTVRLNNKRTRIKAPTSLLRQSDKAYMTYTFVS